jgi:hypothetical protein
MLFYSDGLVEAHNGQHEMFGLPHLKTLLEEHADGASFIDFLLSELKRFTGERWEQVDDMTLVGLHRTQREPISRARGRVCCRSSVRASFCCPASHACRAASSGTRNCSGGGC